MNEYVKAAWVALLCAPWSMGSVDGAEPPSTGVRVTAGEITKSGDLKFIVNNESGRAVKIFESDLPWGVRKSLVLLVLPAGIDQTPLSPSLYIDDPGPTNLTIPPRATIIGTVHLRDRFPDLDSERKHRDLLVFWSYQLRVADGTLGPRFFGGLLLPRKQ